jgi:hypothetical protein
VQVVNAALPPVSVVWARIVALVVVVVLILVLVKTGCDPYLAVGVAVAATGAALRLVRGH